MNGYTGRLSVRGTLAAAGVVACLLISIALGQTPERQILGEPLDPSDPLFGLTPLILPDTPDAPPVISEDDGLREELDCYELGIAGANPSYTATMLLIGNRIDVHVDRVLRRIRPVLRVDSAGGATVKLWFAVYEKGAIGDPTWTRIWYQSRTVFMTNQAAQYESPEIGVTLSSSSRHYLVAVGWETPAVRFWRVTQGSGVVDYGAGYVFGCEVKESFVPPPAETMSYVASQNRFAMDVCFTPLPGACCLGAVCEDEFLITPDLCAAGGGVFSAPGLSCEDITCPLRTGACCNFGGQDDCYITSWPWCTWNDGTYGGHNTNCDICDPPGACCLFGGDCVDFLTESECEALDSTGWRVNQVCPAPGSPEACPVQGACCPVSGTGCYEWGPDLCGLTHGSYQGNGVHCDEGPCETAIGACCWYDGTGCTANVTRYECEQPSPDGLGGVWKGEGSLCVTANCVARGACCDGLACTETTLATCTSSYPSRVWLAGERCEGNPCLDDIGACCVEGVCSETTQNACFLAFGSFTINATCAEVDCLPVGACCLPGGGCQVGSISECDAVGGEFQGFGSSCEMPGICEPGACCLPGGGCSDLTDTACASAGGNFQGLGTACADPDVCEPGACCLPGGGCSEMTPAECTVEGGVYQGAGTACSDPGVCDLGACCLPDGGCNDTTAGGCPATLGYFQGVGTACATPDVCPTCDDYPGLGNGDYTGDGPANWRDALEFPDCMTDPGELAELSCRCAFDFDLDYDVDIEDFLEFQLVYCVYCGCTEFDYDNSGTLDDVDTAAFADCFSGPDAYPNPQLDPDGHPQKCLCVFDKNKDGAVDLFDFQLYQEEYVGYVAP